MRATLVFFLFLLLALAAAPPAAAQARRAPPPPARRNATPPVSLRPFFVATLQNFAAMNTFKAIFGRQLQPFWGGGLDIAFRNGFFVDATASRFGKTGQRVFRFDGRNFPLGIPLTVTEIPFEATVGYRYQTPGSKVVPYVGGGVGSYSYRETSQGDDSGEGIDARRLGYLAVGGVEFRMGRWVGLSGDLQYTKVGGILGTGGFSKAVDENDLGGAAVRFRVIIGR